MGCKLERGRNAGQRREMVRLKIPGARDAQQQHPGFEMANVSVVFQDGLVQGDGRKASGERQGEGNSGQNGRRC